MKFNIDLTIVLKAIVDNMPKDQIGPVTCYLATVGLVAYKLKLEHDCHIAALNAA